MSGGLPKLPMLRLLAQDRGLGGFPGRLCPPVLQPPGRACPLHQRQQALGKGHLVNIFSSASHAVSVTAPLCHHKVKGPQITWKQAAAVGSQSNPPTRGAPGLSGCVYPCVLGPFRANPRPSTNAPCCLFSNPGVLTSGVPDAAGAGVWEPHFEHRCSKLPLTCLFPNPISHASPLCPALSTLPPPHTHWPTALCLSLLPVRPLG